jgi:hypothetical protein
MKFSTMMFQDGNNTGIEVPPDVVEALGAGKRPPVVVNVNGFSYRSTVAPMGGKFLIPFSAARRQDSGIRGGDAVEVDLTLDTAPRTIDVPTDLRAALDASPESAAVWETLSFSSRKAHVEAVAGAKAAETRSRRIAAIVAKLG